MKEGLSGNMTSCPLTKTNEIRDGPKTASRTRSNGTENYKANLDRNAGGKNVLQKDIIVANLKNAEKMSHPLNTALPSHEGQTQPANAHHPSQASTHPLAPPVHTQTETESSLCASTRCTAHHPPRQHLHRNRSDLREPESPCNYHTEPASGHNTRHPA